MSGRHSIGTWSKTKTLGRPAVAAKIAALTVVLVMVQGLGSRFLPAAREAGGQLPGPSANFLAIVAVVLLLQTIALAYPVIRSRWDADLLDARYARRIISESGFTECGLSYLVFFPPVLSLLLPLEKYLRAVPFGAQYCLVAKKA